MSKNHRFPLVLILHVQKWLLFAHVNLNSFSFFYSARSVPLPWARSRHRPWRRRCAPGPQWRRHGLQALQGFFRLAVLDGAQHRVEDQYRKNDNGALHIAGQHGDHSGGNENHHQQVLAFSLCSAVSKCISFANSASNLSCWSISRSAFSIASKICSVISGLCKSTIFSPRFS